MEFEGDEHDLSKILAALEAEIKATTEALNEAKKESEDDEKDLLIPAEGKSSQQEEEDGKEEKEEEEEENDGSDGEMDQEKIETIRELINRIRAIDAEIADLEAPMTPVASAIFLAQSFSSTGKNDTVKVSTSDPIDVFGSDPEFSFESDISPEASTSASAPPPQQQQQQQQSRVPAQTVILRSAEQLMKLATESPSDVADIIDCYRAALGLCATKSFEKHPENVILVANTFRYLSSRVVHLMATESGDHHSADESKHQPALFELALALDAAAKEIIDKEVAARGKSLCGFFEANEKNLGNKWDREKITAVETAIHFTILTAEDYTKSWAEVTPDCRELAALVDALLYVVGSETIKKVEMMGDITAKESTNVSKVLGLVLPMGPALRKLCGPEMEGSLPPIWHKLGVMMALMDMNLAKIHEGINAKDFVEFEKEELVSLVEHLFTDTENRANLIARIRREGLK